MIAATLDTKCPPGQVRSYLGALRRAGAAHESMWLETGHDGYTGAHHVAVLHRALGFLDQRLRRAPAAHRTPVPRWTGSSEAPARPVSPERKNRSATGRRGEAAMQKDIIHNDPLAGDERTADRASASR